MTKFSRTQKFTKANIANVPQDKAIIYKIKSRSGENLYTGIAWSWSRAGSSSRAQGHQKRANTGGNEVSVCTGKNEGARPPD
ncbi:MAG: hypothetical protein UT90_C0026G0003 [Parcubacteria group bacterium GW2011_GWA1_40_21]|nr:MAG: hypothetical protein UT90_C0026G0003 [Parcubacteria group bacterium GW2011_GWA1_40_21]